MNHITEIRLSELADQENLTKDEKEHIDSCINCKEILHSYQLVSSELHEALSEISVPNDLEQFILSGLEYQVEEDQDDKHYFIYTLIVAILSLAICFYFFPIKIDYQLNFSFLNKLSNVVSGKNYLFTAAFAMISVLGLEKILRKRKIT